MIFKNIFNRRKKEKQSPFKINNWNECSIKDYLSLMDIINDNSLTQDEKNVEVLAVLLGVETETVLNMSVKEISELTSKTYWINDFSFDKTKKVKKLKVGDYVCELKYNLNDFSFSQFQDFQRYQKLGPENHIAETLSCFIIPKGMKYNDGYDVIEFINDIKENVSIIDANKVFFSSLNSYRNSLKTLQTSLRKIAKKMLKEEEKKPQTEETRKILKQIRTVLYG